MLFLQMAGQSETRIVLVLCLIFASNLVCEAANRTVCCPEFIDGYYDAYYNFPKKIIRNYHGISVDQPFVGQGCNAKGTLKLTIQHYVATQRRFLIDILFSKPEGMVLNLGDSSSNNGFGGDDGTQSNDAEIQFYENQIEGYANEKYGNILAFTMPDAPTYRLTMLVADGHVTMIPDCNATALNYFSGDDLFQLNGQDDMTGPVNYDLYLAINQNIGTPKILGSG
ncbi:hypothetical protein BgiMline_019708, partial [Biomphalaria glabrata]